MWISTYFVSFEIMVFFVGITDDMCSLNICFTCTIYLFIYRIRTWCSDKWCVCLAHNEPGAIPGYAARDLIIVADRIPPSTNILKSPLKLILCGSYNCKEYNYVRGRTSNCAYLTHVIRIENKSTRILEMTPRYGVIGP